MAAVAKMGEVEEIHSKDDGAVVNGDASDVDMEVQENESVKKPTDEAPEKMEVDEVVTETSSENIEEENDKPESKDDGREDAGDESVEVTCLDDSGNSSKDDEDKSKDEENTSGEVHEIADDDDDISQGEKPNGLSNDEESEDKKDASETIELHDSGGEDEGDVVIIDNPEPKQNGISEKLNTSEEPEVIELDTTPVKKQKETDDDEKKAASITPRRSSRNLNKQKSYVEEDDVVVQRPPPPPRHVSDESDIEEVLPEDPLANIGDSIQIEKIPMIKRKLLSANPGTIVVKDTKKLVEIAAKSNNNSAAGKKEPTLVIIDTNSILSGRGAIPVVNKPSPAQPPTPSYPTVLPMALPAQGMYPANMRATITPIPAVPQAQKAAQSIPQPPIQQQPPLLPTLTDDMFVVEAPSFIVPYVYEKPPVGDLKQFIDEYKKQVEEAKKAIEEKKKMQKEEVEKDKEQSENKDKEDKEKVDKDGKDKDEKDKDEKDKDEKDKDDKEKNENEDEKGTHSEDEKDDKESEEVAIEKEEKDQKKVKEEDKIDDPNKPYSYFSSPLGKFFIDIGVGLVQEYVQTDLLKQQKRKRDRERGKNPETLKTIESLIKNLEFSKENNEPYKLEIKRCEFCSYKTDSALSLAYHLETPHMKNYVYKCNFCTFEVRSPHDILFHMEAEHAVRGRLERAPAFHQCPNCPFEDNQKSKLSRHMIACSRKFKPDRNLEPPIDWEPPAKIPRVPKLRQGLSATAYQALSKNSFQFLSKMPVNNNAINRGRGRPSLMPNIRPQSMVRPTGMVYKQTMSGGSVLVPTNYQLSGNQVYQVVGGQELGGHLCAPGHMAYVPNIPAASSTSQQNQSPKPKPVNTPSISITPLPRATSSSANTSPATAKPGDTNSKNSFVICEICDGYIKDLEQLRNHMQWIHKVKIHPKMIYNRPPLNCQKCQFRFFTDQGLERHLLGSHGLVTSSMQDAANRSKDAGRCPVCGRVYQWKLLNHVARDHNMTLKPAHLSYKCTVCTATFGMYKQFENHVYSAHSVVAKRVMDKKGTSSPSSSNKTDQAMKPLKINDEITIIPQPAKANINSSKEGSPLSTGSTNARTNAPSTSKNPDTTSTSMSRAERLARRNATGADD